MAKYKSKFEKRIAEELKKKKKKVKYENVFLPYIQYYLPDWEIAKDTYIEAKGYFSARDRAKMIAVKLNNPTIKIYLLFGNAENKLNAKSKTTYREWATKHGFECADYFKEGIPDTWFQSNARTTHRN